MYPTESVLQQILDTITLPTEGSIRKLSKRDVTYALRNGLLAVQKTGLQGKFHIIYRGGYVSNAYKFVGYADIVEVVVSVDISGNITLEYADARRGVAPCRFKGHGNTLVVRHGARVGLGRVILTSLPE